MLLQDSFKDGDFLSGLCQNVLHCWCDLLGFSGGVNAHRVQPHRVRVIKNILRLLRRCRGRDVKGGLLCHRQRCRSRSFLLRPVILIGKACVIQALYNAIQCVLKVRRGGQHIGHIQSRDRVLSGIGQAQDAPNDLLHIHLTGAVCQRCKDVGKGAVPALLQCVDGDNKSDGAFGREQVCIFQLIDVGGLNGNLLCRYAVFHKDGAYLLKGGSVLFALGLCLKQYDRADVAAAVAVFSHSLRLQNALHLDSIVQHIQLIVAVHYEHRQLDHVLLTQMNGIHNGDQIAFFGGGSGQVQHKAGVEISEHLLTQGAAGMVALVHDHHRAKLVDDLQQGGGVGIFHRMGGSAQSLRQLRQTAVLLPCLELLFFAPEGIVGQHQNRKLLGNGRDVEPCGRQ